MFNIGDIMIYSTHGLCKINDISEKTFNDITRTYYVMNPIEDSNLTISVPVEGNESKMFEVIGKEKAQEILQSFQGPGIEWIADLRQRNKKYNDLVNTGDRQAISKIINTLMRKELQAKKNQQKVPNQDRDLLNETKRIMFKELAIALDTTSEQINQKVKQLLKQTA